MNGWRPHQVAVALTSLAVGLGAMSGMRAGPLSATDQRSDGELPPADVRPVSQRTVDAASLGLGGPAKVTGTPESTSRPPVSRGATPWLPDGGVEATMTGGNTIGADVRETAPRSDGFLHIDTPRLVKRLKDLGVNTYVYGIWDSPTDWDDLRLEFLPAADRAHIDVWVYLVPPTECSDSADRLRAGRCSRPFKLDFIAWAREISALSSRYQNLSAWAIDDFSIPGNAALFTPEYVQTFTQLAKQTNPDLGFYLTTYFSAASNPAFLDKYAPYLDGIIYPFLDDPNWNNHRASTADDRIRDLLALTKPRALGLVFMAYANRYLAAMLPPTAGYVDEALSLAEPMVRSGDLDGIIAYGTPLDGDGQHDLRRGGMWGDGRLSLHLPAWSPTHAGEAAVATQVVSVDPDAPRYELSFWETDGQDGGPAPYHAKQVLLDGQVIWERDATDQLPGVWVNGHDWQGRIDVTDILRGKTSAELTVRLLEKNGVSYFPVDVAFDHFQSLGFEIANPDFEQSGGWKVSGVANLNAVIHLYHEDESSRIFETVRRHFRPE
ncbi:hypothetical protein ABZX12_40720 [Kribbella sp. NPDC003505]|uniref:hypothetical protein n=1 Tax=Kribbella sp. NPDC003505 TaxID=3154448 RepID=UPI0033BCDFB4